MFLPNHSHPNYAIANTKQGCCRPTGQGSWSPQFFGILLSKSINGPPIFFDNSRVHLQSLYIISPTSHYDGKKQRGCELYRMLRQCFLRKKIFFEIHYLSQSFTLILATSESTFRFQLAIDSALIDMLRYGTYIMKGLQQ